MAPDHGDPDRHGLSTELFPSPGQRGATCRVLRDSPSPRHSMSTGAGPSPVKPDLVFRVLSSQSLLKSPVA